jgi:hypothetical protein
MVHEVVSIHQPARLSLSADCQGVQAANSSDDSQEAILQEQVHRHLQIIRVQDQCKVGELGRGKEIGADVVANEQLEDHGFNSHSACLHGKHLCLNFRLEDLNFDRPLMRGEEITYTALFGGGARGITI